MVQRSSILHGEIREQPDIIRRFLAAEVEHIAEIGHRLSRQEIRYAMLSARGTSGNAARYGQYLLGALNRLPVALSTPSLFTVYQCPPRMEDALVIGISQSGQSPDIVSVVEEANRQGAPTVAITNDPRSPLAAAARYSINLHAGVERSVAATKTYTTQLAALALLAMSLAGMPLRPGPLEGVAALVEQALEAEPATRTAAERLADADRCVVLGRGFNFATAFEIALKAKELTYVVAEPYSSAAFRHGPIALVEQGFPVILLVIGETVRGEMLALRQAVRERGARLVVLGDDETVRHVQDLWIPVPAGLPEWLTPLVAVVPGQLLAFHLALARGLDPDQPRELKKVTLTH